MSLKIRFLHATATGIVLAKVGNPQRDEPLQTSKEVYKIGEEDRAILTPLFLKPFKNLVGHRFHHHSSLDKHEMHNLVRSIFTSKLGLLEKGRDIARRLYSKSNHPNIKSGDLCIALIDDIEVEGEMKQGLCILKAESMVPFISITTQDGDLKLATEHGINPEKIDKGCLIIDFMAEKGCYALTFDRGGEDTRFWVREFLGLQAVPDSAFLTNAYASMAVQFLEQNQPAEDEAPPWDTCTAARDALNYFDDREHFDLEEFQEKVLRTPERVEKFTEQRARLEEEQGQPLPTSFEISQRDITKAKKKIGTVLKLDTGIEIHVKPSFSEQEQSVLERGFDEERGMKFIKVFFNESHSER